MNAYEKLKSGLLEINQRVLSLLNLANATPGTSRRPFGEWEDICHSIARQLSEESIRIAVIGAIKSGKSTLINSIFSGDYLKRGAGVVTSMVTRVRRGKRLKAALYFKSWHEINADIDRSLVLFLSMEWRSRKEGFDIRNDSDRAELQKALGSLETKQLIRNDMRNLDSLYLSSYLKGYDRAKGFLSSERLKQEYVDAEFSAHRDFSGNEVLSFFLKDIALEIDTGIIDRSIEIADCQGSDSPNPLHMAMIQDYLLQANLLIYVISSRTGIRQADINFLSMIRKMGLIEHIIFVVNFDFSEHESLADLEAVAEKINEDLKTIKKDPEVYTYSALFSLFCALEETLPPRDRQRLAQWRGDAALVSHSQMQEERFLTRLRQVVTRQRYALLLKSHLERLKMIVSGLGKWIAVNQDILTKGADETSQMLKKIKAQQKKTDRVKSIVKNTLEGAMQQIKREIKTNVDRFFDARSGEVVPDLIAFVGGYTIGFDQYRERLAASGFTDTLYLVFQEFKHGIDTFMAENVNPKIFSFVKVEEEKIEEFFSSVSGPYETMAHEALVEYNAALEGVGPGVSEKDQRGMPLVDIKTLKQSSRLELPPASATMNYSTAIKTEAIMRLGLYNFVKELRRLFRRPAKDETENALAALKDAVARMKKETAGSLIFHFKNYKENIKFQYLLHLVDTVSDHLYRVLMERFHDYTEDLSALTHSTSKKQVDKAQLSASLEAMSQQAGEIQGLIGRFDEAFNRAFD